MLLDKFYPEISSYNTLFNRTEDDLHIQYNLYYYNYMTMKPSCLAGILQSNKKENKESNKVSKPKIYWPEIEELIKNLRLVKPKVDFGRMSVVVNENINSAGIASFLYWHIEHLPEFENLKLHPMEEIDFLIENKKNPQIAKCPNLSKLSLEILNKALI